MVEPVHVFDGGALDVVEEKSRISAANVGCAFLISRQCRESTCVQGLPSGNRRLVTAAGQDTSVVVRRKTGALAGCYAAPINKVD